MTVPKLDLQEKRDLVTEPDILGFLDRRPAKGGQASLAAAKRLVYTYTILNAYRNVCPHQMFRRYIARDLGPYVQSPEAKWGDDVHKAFEVRLSAGKPLPDNMRQWEPFAAPFDGRKPLCEQQLAMTAKGKPAHYFNGPDLWFRGKADAVAIKETVAHIADWKTGGSKYEDPFELECSALLLRVHHPHLTRITGNYAWLKENRLGQKYDLSDFRGTFQKMCAIVKEIEADRSSGEFDKKQSGLCGWCAVKDCENHRERT